MTRVVRRVAVTGATGFIGTRLCAALVAEGCAVRALTRGARPARAGVEWITGALTDPDVLARLVDGAEAVVHCAGAVRGHLPEDFHEANVAAPAALAAAMARHAPQARLLVMSSLAAREPGLSAYAASKRAGEAAATYAGVMVTVFRPPAVYGPGDRELRPLLDGLYRGLGFIPGHRGRFALIFVDDLVDAVLAWLARPAAVDGCFELDDGTTGGYDWDMVIDAVGRLRGRRVVALRIPRRLLGAVARVNGWLQGTLGRQPMLTAGKVRELYHPDWTCDGAPFARLTGWRPKVGLADGLRLTLVGPVRDDAAA